LVVDLEKEIRPVRDTKLIEVIVGGRDVKIALRSGLRKDGRRWANQFVVCGERPAFVPSVDPEICDTEPGYAVNDTAGNLEKFCCVLRRFGLPAGLWYGWRCLGLTAGLFYWLRWLCLLGFLCHGFTS
jgi:hypothetical protein